MSQNREGRFKAVPPSKVFGPKMGKAIEESNARILARAKESQKDGGNGKDLSPAFNISTNGGFSKMSEHLDKRIEDLKAQLTAKIEEFNKLNNDRREIDRKLAPVRAELVRLEAAVNELIELKKAETGEKIDNIVITEQPLTPQS